MPMDSRANRAASARGARRGIKGIGKGQRTLRVLEAISQCVRANPHEIHALASKPQPIKERGVRGILCRLVQRGLAVRQIDRNLDGTYQSTAYQLTDAGKAKLKYLREKLSDSVAINT